LSFCNAILRIRYVGDPDNLITVSLITVFLTTKLSWKLLTNILMI